MKGAALRFLKLSWLAGPTAGPVLQMMLGVAIIIGSMLLWAVLLFRKAAVLLVAVFAPVAFAEAVWDQTRGWSRRWIETMAALVLCKVVIVVVFVLGVSAFATNGTTQTAAGVGKQSSSASLSDLLVGLMLLSIAVFAPWLTFKFVHWSGMEAAPPCTVLWLPARFLAQFARRPLRRNSWPSLRRQVRCSEGRAAQSRVARPRRATG